MSPSGIDFEKWTLSRDFGERVPGGVSIVHTFVLEGLRGVLEVILFPR
jgi:hypothetical protein